MKNNKSIRELVIIGHSSLEKEIRIVMNKKMFCDSEDEKLLTPLYNTLKNMYIDSIVSDEDYYTINMDSLDRNVELLISMQKTTLIELSDGFISNLENILHVGKEFMIDHMGIFIKIMKDKTPVEGYKSEKVKEAKESLNNMNRQARYDPSFDIYDIGGRYDRIRSNINDNNYK